MRRDWKLRTEDDVRAFADFVTSSTADGAFLRLRHLDILFDPDTIILLALSQLERLLVANANTLSVRHLSLEDAETMFDIWPKLVDAFAGLSITEQLSIKGVGEHTVAMLIDMKSQLKVVDLVLEGDKWAIPGTESLSSNPIALLRASQATLQTLTVYGATTDGLGNEIYPAMRDLELNLVDKIYTSDYARAFPGLTTIAIYDSTFDDDSDTLSEDARRLRHENRQNQLEYGRWDDLQLVEASLVNVYVLGLRTRVKTMELLAATKKCTAGMLSTVLQETSWPDKLSLTTKGSRIRDKPSILSSLRQTRCAKSIYVNLTLNVWFESDESAYSVHLTLVMKNRVKHELKYASIRTLDITLDCTHFHPKTDSDTVAPEEERRLRELTNYLAELDVKRLLTELAMAVRSLKKVTVALWGYPTREDQLQANLDWSGGWDNGPGKESMGDSEDDELGEEDYSDGDISPRRSGSDAGSDLDEEEEDLSDGYQTECEV